MTVALPSLPASSLKTLTLPAAVRGSNPLAITPPASIDLRSARVRLKVSDHYLMLCNPPLIPALYSQQDKQCTCRLQPRRWQNTVSTTCSQRPGSISVQIGSAWLHLSRTARSRPGVLLCATATILWRQETLQLSSFGNLTRVCRLMLCT